jgi:hypothetical protein
MSNPVSLGTMVARVQNRANLQNLQTNVSQADIRDFLNESIQEMFDEQIAQRGMEYFREVVSFNTVPNQSAYSLPLDFYELISMDVFVAPQQVLTARPYMEYERNRFRWYPGWVTWLPVFFRLLGTATMSGATLTPGTINFIPAPSMIAQFSLNYIPCFQPFATDGTQDSMVIDGVNGWEGMAVWNAVAMCKEKLQEDPAFALGKVEQFRARIQAMAGDRHAGDPERIHDVQVDYDIFGFAG